MQTSPQTPPRTSPRTPRRTRGRILVAAALGIVLTALVPVLNGTRTPASAAGTAPGSPGLASTWGPGEKSFLGTSRTTTSKVYFTGYRGIISEVFNPVADTVETVDLQFLVGDTAKTFVDEEKLQNYTVTQPNPRSMRWQTTTANPGHRWSITKNIFTDPGRDALIARVTLNATGGASLGDLDLYLLHNPAMDNSGAGDTSSTLTAGGRTLLVSSQGSRASALAVSRPWRTAGGTPMVSSGFVGASDGWTDLLGAGPNGTADKTKETLDMQAKAGIKSVNFGPEFKKVAVDVYWDDLKKLSPASRSRPAAKLRRRTGFIFEIMRSGHG